MVTNIYRTFHSTGNNWQLLRCFRNTTEINLNFNLRKFDNLNNLFANFKQLTTLSLANNCNLIGIQSLDHMFCLCSNLQNLDFSQWQTQTIKDFSGMFNGCWGLQQLNISEWNVNNAINFSQTFNNCKNLVNLDVSKWNISNVTNLYETFANCNILKTLDVSNWNTNNIIDLSRAFWYCNNLTNLDVSKWNTSNIINLSNTFYCCSNLKTLDVSNWNTNNINNLSYVFSGCYNLTNLDVSNWNTDKVTNLYHAFGSCYNLITLNVSKWNTSNVTDLSRIFDRCVNLKTLNISNWNVSNVTDLGYMFDNCYNYNGELNLSQWNTAKVQDMSRTFLNLGGALNNYSQGYDEPVNCVNLLLENWTFNNVTNLSYFLTNVQMAGLMWPDYLFGSNYDNVYWNTKKVTNMSYTFSFIPSLFCISGDRESQGGVLNWYINTDNVKDLSGAFSNAGYLAKGLDSTNDYWGGYQIYLHLSDVSKVENTAYCFTCNKTFDPWSVGPQGAWDEWEPRGSIFDLSMQSSLNFYNVRNAAFMFYNYSTWDNFIPKIIFHEVENLNNAFAYTTVNIAACDILNWNLYKATDISQMFANTSIGDSFLTNFATILVNASNVTRKNLYNNNVYSPLYNSIRYINNTTVGSSLVSQLRAAGWSIPE